VVISPRRWRREFVGVRMGFRPGVPHASSVDASAAAKFGYNPALDGLRAVAIFVVLAGHMGAVRASNVAVDVFFVLSGFLITALMLAEQARTGTVSIGRFIVRRIYRLMPAMWFYLLVGLAVTLAFKRDDYVYRKDYAGSALSSFFLSSMSTTGFVWCTQRPADNGSRTSGHYPRRSSSICSGRCCSWGCCDRPGCGPTWRRRWAC
jgi:hypothetical protein